MPSISQEEYDRLKAAETNQETPAGYVSRSELEELLADRDAKHAQQVAALQVKVPVAMVPKHAGGPGIDQHQASWNLAEQEAAARGEILDHWV